MNSQMVGSCLNLASPAVRDQLCEEFRRAKEPLLILDCDGTVVDIHPSPNSVVIPGALLLHLGVLGRKKGARVIIVSGRGMGWLMEKFGHLNITLIGRHGRFIREPGKKVVEREFPTEWTQRVATAVERRIAEIEGLKIKDHDGVVAVDNNGVDESHHREIRKACKSILEEFHRVELHHNHLIAEFINQGGTKRSAVMPYVNGQDFIAQAGDGGSDEDLREGLPGHAHTIVVGRPHSSAKYCAGSPCVMRRTLQDLAYA